jgi:Fe-S-cluster containining protein
MDPSQTTLCFPLSEAERLRLAPYARGAGKPDHALAETVPPFLRAMKNLFPGCGAGLEALFPSPGNHAILPILSDGSCVFLGPSGCDLPRDTRPWYCRLFPLWFHKKKIDRFIPRECLITREVHSVGGILAALGIDAAGALELHASLCRDWGLS